MLTEDMSYLRNRPISIICHTVNQHRNAARRIAFITNFLVRNAFKLAGSSLDRPVNRIASHIGSERLVNCSTESRV